jgi:hypothetical protein
VAVSLTDSKAPRKALADDLPVWVKLHLVRTRSLDGGSTFSTPDAAEGNEFCKLFPRYTGMWTTFFITEGNTDLSVWWLKLSEAFATERKETEADPMPILTPPSTPAMPNPDNPVLELPFDHYVLHNANGELPKAKKGRLLAEAEKTQDNTQQEQLKAGDLRGLLQRRSLAWTVYLCGVQ